MRSDSFSNGFVWLGVVVGALSSLKALNVFLNFGFKGIWADILDFYSKLTLPFRELISRIPLFTELPNWFPDALLLYTVLVMTGLRATVLPFRFDDYYRMHNTRRTYDVKFPRKGIEEFDDFFERQTEFEREEFIAAHRRDEYFVVTLQEIIPRWELVARQSLICMTLLPVITLEPFRKMDNSIFFVRNMLKKAKPNDNTIEFSTKDGKGFYARWAIEVDKMRLDGAAQIVSLPALVILFLLEQIRLIRGHTLRPRNSAGIPQW